MPLFHPAVLGPKQQRQVELCKLRLKYADHRLTEDQKICRDWHQRNTDRRLTNIGVAHHEHFYRQEIEAAVAQLAAQGIEPPPGNPFAEPAEPPADPKSEPKPESPKQAMEQQLKQQEPPPNNPFAEAKSPEPKPEPPKRKSSRPILKW